MKRKILKNLQTIPGVGKSIEKDLFSLGIFSVSDLNGKNPEILYKKINKKAEYGTICAFCRFFAVWSIL